jgi:hypothetical protein
MFIDMKGDEINAELGPACATSVTTATTTSLKACRGVASPMLAAPARSNVDHHDRRYAEFLELRVWSGANAVIYVAERRR